MSENVNSVASKMPNLDINIDVDGLSPDEVDVAFIRVAMQLAHLAEQIDEVPVGALVVRDGKIISMAYNTRETSRCATHHAEVLAIEEACRVMGGWRLPGVTLYVTM